MLTTSCGDAASTGNSPIAKKQYVLAFKNKEDKDQGIKLLALLKEKCEPGKAHGWTFEREAKNDNHAFGNVISSLYDQLKEKKCF